ncbi:MAG TPA: transglycosylase domain-containing protein [Bacteroidales bacterium]|nr:transglycosylase domain-containing protein [Bacteroidales bacterium]
MKTTSKIVSKIKGTNVPPDFARYIRRMWRTFFVSAIVLYLFFIGVSFGILGPIPSFEQLENPSNNLASEIYSSDQQLLGKFYVENRTNVEYQQLSPFLVQALIATEDIRFEKHSGVDARGIIRVIVKTIAGGNRSSGGGSTITQQLAKNLFPRDVNMSKIELVKTKFKEWVTAIRLERNYTKEEIIAMYLNTVDFGSQSFGIKSAAKTYFDKTPDSLSIQESAMLVGMLQAPSKYNPVRNPKNAMKRRFVVLGQMAKYGYISMDQLDSLKDLPLSTGKYKLQDHKSGMATYFREYLRKIMNESEPERNDFPNDEEFQIANNQWDNNPLYGWCNKNTKPDGTKYNLYTDGLKIYTTIDSRMQLYAEQAVSEHLGKTLQPQFNREVKHARYAPFTSLHSKEEVDKLLELSKRRSDRYIQLKNDGASKEQIDKVFNEKVPMRLFSWKGEFDTVMTPMDSIRYYKWFLHAGFMAVEPQTGYVKAYVGGINYKYFKFDHVCLSRRQVGSTFKPFVYSVAMADGQFSPCTKIPMIPVTIDLGDGKTWSPRNSGKVKEGEMVTLRYALAGSINWASAYLIKRSSPVAVIRLARKMGVTSPIPPVYAICLGVAELTVYEMVGAQTTYVNKGIYTEPIFVTRIEDKDGNVLSDFVPRRQEAMSEEAAYLMIELMKGVVDGGTSGRIRSVYNIKHPIAGKTGTTDDNSDGWFMGLTPELVAGCWVGAEDMQVHFISTGLGQGANMALPIWAIFMQKVYADKTINLSTEDFDKPSKPLSVEIDCKKYAEEHPEENVVKHGLNPFQ